MKKKKKLSNGRRAGKTIDDVCCCYYVSPYFIRVVRLNLSGLECGRQPREEAVEGQEERDEQYEQGHETQRRRLQ